MSRLVGTCKRGHSRALHSRYDANGRVWCYTCKLLTKRLLRARKRGETVEEPPPPLTGYQWLYNWRWDEDALEMDEPHQKVNA